MSRTSTLEQPGDAAVRSEDGPEPARGARTIARLGAWMAILGVIRLTCGIAEYVHICREALGSNVGAGRGWGRFFLENPPIFVLVGAWPLLLGLTLRRTRWPELVKAGALTFLVLAVGGVLTAMADWGHAAGGSVAIGSFRVPRLAWDQLEPAGKAMAMAGAVQWLLELATGVYAAVLAFRRQGAGDVSADRNDSVRRSRFGRLAICLSIAFVVLTTRLPAWSTVLEFVTQSQWIREVLLRDDLARIRTARPKAGPASAWAAGAQILYDEAAQAWSEGRYAVASEKYSRLAVLLEPIPTATMNSAERRLAALALNNWAWLLATCPDTALRDAAASVKCARRALEIVPNDANTWNTLGVAYFRLGAWDEARSALYRSMELRNEGDSFDWFFLAMIHAKLGHKERRASGTTRRRNGRIAACPATASSIDSRSRPPRRWASPSPSRNQARPRRPACHSGTAPFPPASLAGEADDRSAPARCREDAETETSVPVDGSAVSEHTPAARGLPLARGAAPGSASAPRTGKRPVPGSPRRAQADPEWTRMSCARPSRS